MNAPKVISHIETAIPHGTEHQTELEMCNAQGEPVRVKQFMRKTDWEDSYTVLMHTVRGSDPPMIALTTGLKGQVEGEHRLDRVEIVMIGIDGSVIKIEPREVRVLINNSYAGLSFEEILLRVGQDRPPSCYLSSSEKS
jgi:hypothetical protein